MREYPVKRKLWKQLSVDSVAKTMEEIFGNAEINGDTVVSSYGSLSKIVVKIDDKKIFVETESQKDVAQETMMDTIKKYNEFLYRVTGYTAKERKKLLMKG